MGWNLLQAAGAAFTVSCCSLSSGTLLPNVPKLIEGRSQTCHLQTDIKKVLAYSTVSQLGFMFLAAGVGAYTAAIFHLFTHAFFKALLFLGAGSVITAMRHEQELPKMGGLAIYMPTTYKTMWIAWMAICGIIPFAGFWSKDEILWKTFSTSAIPVGKLLWVIGFITAGFTAFYMTRLMMLTFRGKERFNTDHGHIPHESPRNMTIPLIALAAGSIVVGFLGVPQSMFGSNHFERWLEPVIQEVHQGVQPTAGVAEAPALGTSNGAQSASSEGDISKAPAPTHEKTNPIEYILMLLSLGIAVGGIWLGKLFYEKRPELAVEWGKKLKPLYTLSFNKWYWDYLLDVKGVEAGIAANNALWKIDSVAVDGGVNGSAWLTRMWSRISGWWDTWVIDTAVNATGWVTQAGSLILRAFQTGHWQNYALLFVMGLFVILILYIYPAIPWAFNAMTGK